MIKNGLKFQRKSREVTKSQNQYEIKGGQEDENGKWKVWKKTLHSFLKERNLIRPGSWVIFSNELL